MEKIIEDYTRESGVRDLDRQLASVMRNQAKQYAVKGKIKPNVGIADIEKNIGQAPFYE